MRELKHMKMSSSLSLPLFNCVHARFSNKWKEWTKADTHTILWPQNIYAHKNSTYIQKVNAKENEQEKKPEMKKPIYIHNIDHNTILNVNEKTCHTMIIIIITENGSHEEIYKKNRSINGRNQRETPWIRLVSSQVLYMMNLFLTYEQLRSFEFIMFFLNSFY